MQMTRIFQNGNSQALRIPQEFRTSTKEYYISKIGDTIIAYPAEDPWAPLKQVIGTFSDDFISERKQPDWSEVPIREEL